MHYSPVRHSPPKWCVRLACIRHAASVHPEPGSNSPLSYVKTLSSLLSSLLILFEFRYLETLFSIDVFLFSFQCSLLALSSSAHI